MQPTNTSTNTTKNARTNTNKNTRTSTYTSTLKLLYVPQPVRKTPDRTVAIKTDCGLCNFASIFRRQIWTSLRCIVPQWAILYKRVKSVLVNLRANNCRRGARPVNNNTMRQLLNHNCRWMVLYHNLIWFNLIITQWVTYFKTRREKVQVFLSKLPN